jgi:hypothetical protein
MNRKTLSGFVATLGSSAHKRKKIVFHAEQGLFEGFIQSELGSFLEHVEKNKIGVESFSRTDLIAISSPPPIKPSGKIEVDLIELKSIHARVKSSGKKGTPDINQLKEKFNDNLDQLEKAAKKALSIKSFYQVIPKSSKPTLVVPHFIFTSLIVVVNFVDDEIGKNTTVNKLFPYRPKKPLFTSHGVYLKYGYNAFEPCLEKYCKSKGRFIIPLKCGDIELWFILFSDDKLWPSLKARSAVNNNLEITQIFKDWRIESLGKMKLV